MCALRTSAVGLADVSIYDFDDQGKPTSYIGAIRTEIGKDGQWVGHDVRQIIFADKSITDQVEPSLALDVFLNTRQTDILSITPAMLALDELYQYIQVLQNRGQNTDQFVLALWQKMTLPFKVGAMLFFSLPFVFGAAREANPRSKSHAWRHRRHLLLLFRSGPWLYGASARHPCCIHDSFATRNHHFDRLLAVVQGALDSYLSRWSEVRGSTRFVA